MSATTGFGYGDLTLTSTISETGWSPSHPAANVKTRDLAEYAESTGNTATFTLDHGGAKAAQLFALFAHTCEDANATIGVTRGTTSGGFDVWASDAEDAWAFSPLGDDRDGSHFGLFLIAPAETIARYTQVVVTGSAPMRFSRLIVCPLFVPTYNPEYGKTVDDWMPQNSIVDRAENGADQAIARTELRSAAFDYSALTGDQASLFHEILRTHGVTEEVVYVRDSVDRAKQQQYGFLGLMRKLSALENPFYRHQSAAIAIDERGGAP